MARPVRRVSNLACLFSLFAVAGLGLATAVQVGCNPVQEDDGFSEDPAYGAPAGYGYLGYGSNACAAAGGSCISVTTGASCGPGTTVEESGRPSCWAWIDPVASAHPSNPAPPHHILTRIAQGDASVSQMAAPSWALPPRSMAVTLRRTRPARPTSTRMKPGADTA